MQIRFKRETKIVFFILSVIIIAGIIFIVVNYKKLKQPAPVVENTVSLVKGAYVPIEPRGSCLSNCASNPILPGSN